MHTQEIACPNCNGRMWVNVPDPPGEYGWSALVGSTEASTRCPHCRKPIGVSVGTDGGIRNIFVKSEDCLLTTVCCTMKGLPDDCNQLRSIRTLRDNWLICQPSGAQIISLYYRIAPHILSGLRKKLTARLFHDYVERAFNKYVEPSADAWEQGKPENAFKLLCDMVEYLAIAAATDIESLTALRRQVIQAQDKPGT